MNRTVSKMSVTDPTHGQSVIHCSRLSCTRSRNSAHIFHGIKIRMVQSTDNRPHISIPHFPLTVACSIPRVRVSSIKEAFNCADLYLYLMTFLPLPDAVALTKTCAALRSSSHRKAMKRYMRKQMLQGLHTLRRSYWRCVAHITDSRPDSSYYFQLKSGKSPFIHSIIQDVERTQGRVAKAPISNATQTRLIRVLGAVSLHRKELGYCQGMNYIMAALLQVLSEEESFWAFNSLCERQGFDDVFSPGMYRVRCVCNAINKYVIIWLPEIAKKLKLLEITAEMYAARWIITLFARDMQLNVLLRVWDLFLFDGWKAVIRVVLATLQLCEQEIVGSEDGDVLSVCQKAPQNPKFNEPALYSSQGFKVTRAALTRLDLDFLEKLQQHTESTVNLSGLISVLKDKCG